MRKITLLISAIAFTLGGAIAQNKISVKSDLQINNPTVPEYRTCGTMEADAALKAKYPYMESFDDFEKWLAPKVQNYKALQANGANPEVVYNIPVVVHVIHNGESVNTGSNISSGQIQSQIDVLNEDFSRTNGDKINTPSTFTGVASNCEITFCLAQVYPTGHANAGQPMPSPGIDRVNRNTAGFAAPPYDQSAMDNTIKPATFWNPNEVMNIWVVSLTSQLLGYAQFPNSSGLGGLNINGGNANTDGVVIGYNYFGRVGNVSSPYNKGRTTTHEVGHWLGLRHIGGDQNGGCGNDYCNDTPPQKGGQNFNGSGNDYGQNYGCPSHPLVRSGECSGTTAEMFMNFMDYVDDNCMNMFTADQKARIQTVMSVSPRRSSLNSSTVCNVSGAVVADFTASSTTINVGQTVTFTDASTGSGITNWSWDFDVAGLGGVTPGTANTQGAHVVTYNNAGTYSVSLMVSDGGSNSDTETKTSYITVQSSGSTICDTVSNFIEGSFTPSLNGSAGWGWVSGHNDYDDIGKADYYSAPASGYDITGAQFYFAKNHDGSGSGTIDVKIWDGTSGTPGAVLASETVNISSLNLYPTKTSVSFSSPVTVTNNYFLGIQFSPNGSPQDSIALIHSEDSVDLFANQGTAWELWGDNSWHEFEEDPDSWMMDVALAIFPIHCTSVTGVSEVNNANNISVYPNPTEGLVNIVLNNDDNSEIKVYNLIGETVQVFENIKTNRFEVDMTNQPNGVYFVTIKSGDNVITEKVILSK